MAMSVRRRIGWAAVAILGPLALFTLSAPWLVDAEAYKPALIQAVKEATGRELVIDGPVRVSAFPLPRVSAQQVHFANAPGAEGAQMIDVRWVGASPSWWALLGGHVEVGRLTLYQPTIVLETDAKGVPNWQFKPGAGAAQPEGAPAAGFHLAIGELRIVQGTVSYTNPQTGQTMKAEKVEATASVGSFEGPLSIAGNATVNGVPLSLTFSLGEATPDGHDLSFALQVLSGKLDFKGRISELNAKAEVKGHLDVTTGVLTEFVAAVVRATGQAKPEFDAATVGRFTFDGGIELTPTRLAVTDFKMSMGTETATGSLALEQGKTSSLQGHVTLPKVDLEKWLDLLGKGAFTLPPTTTATPTTAKPATAQAAPKPAPAPAKSATLSPFPPEMDVWLGLDIAELVYRTGSVHDFSAALEIHKGLITMPRLKATLPGDMVLSANAAAAPPPAKPGTKPADPVQASGQISLAGPSLRETLTWLGIDTSGIAQDRLQRLDLNGKLASTANGVQISDLVAELDGQRATGSGSVTFGVPVTVSATVQSDHLDLDPYLPSPPRAKAAATAPADKAAVPAAALVPAASPPPDKTTPVFGLKAKIAKLGLRGQTLGGVDGDMSVQGNLLKLNALKVADLLGGKLDVKGAVTDFAVRPRFDLTFNATLPDADRVIDYAGLPRFANGKIGPASASGGVVGTMDGIALRNASATLLGSTAQMTGTLALGQDFRFDFSNFSLKTGEIGGLLSVATGRPQSTGIGAMSATGAFKGDAKRATFNGNLTALNTAMTGSIDATLGQRPNIVANLRVPGTLDFDDWLGVSAGPIGAANAGAGQAGPVPVRPEKAATGKPIDLAALRSFDATLTLETTAIEVGSVKIDYADLQAKLSNGLFTIGKLTGQFYGGAVDFKGTVDATKNALAVDLAGSLQGIYLGQMLRGTAGRNIFGNENLMVSIDGKINVMDISVKGGGLSSEEIRNSLTGRGQVGGYLYPAVASGSLGFASFATGVGSIFSTEMGFNSAVLAGFINHQSTVTGELTLSAGTLLLKNHTVQGQNAVALITSNTSLTAATTDTTISLDTGARGPSDYVMTVKGPISSPTMTTRGTAN
jgi:uncharacterized protein involved in outer membrane biogenesis